MIHPMTKKNTLQSSGIVRQNAENEEDRQWVSPMKASQAFSAAIVDLLRTQGTLTTPSLDVQVISIVRIEYHVLLKLSRILSNFWYYFLIKIKILIRKASPEGAASFVIYKERNHKTSLICTPCPSGN